MACRLLFIIDHDMTLVDTLGVFYRTYRNACLAHGRSPPPLPRFLEGFCSDSLREPTGVDARSFWSFFKERYRALSARDLRPMRGARGFLAELEKRGHPTVVVSGRGTPAVVGSELERLGLRSLVREVHTVGGRDFDKTRVFAKLAIKWGLPCVAVGDYKMDFKSAVDAGCLALGVTAGCKDAESHRSAGAWLVVEHLGELVGLLELVEEEACRRGGGRQGARR